MWRSERFNAIQRLVYEPFFLWLIYSVSISTDLKDKTKMKLPTDYTKLDWRKGEKAKVREQYIMEQDNKCYYCNESLSEEPPKRITDKKINLDLFPPNMLKHPIHLQHNHETNMTEGAVHAYCNCVLWQYEGR